MGGYLNKVRCEEFNEKIITPINNFDKNLGKNVRPSVIIGTTLLSCVTAHYIRKFFRYFAHHDKGVKAAIIDIISNIIQKTPYMSGKYENAQNKIIEKIKEEIFKKENLGVKTFNVLPQKGITYSTLIKTLEHIRTKESVEKKKLSGALYVGDPNVKNLICDVYKIYSLTNLLHFDLYPCGVKFQREILRMAVNLLHGDKKVVGVITSGGTESIFMAIYAYKEYYRKIKPWIRHPEILLPDSAHPAFDKACHYLGLKYKRIKVDPETFAVDPKKIEKAITKNTIVIVGSAPGFPHGIIDPIKELGAIGKKYEICVHVDSCLGGFYLPFAQRLKYGIPDFDFRVDGVTSISADTHKFGGGPKGASVVLFKNKSLRNGCYFTSNFWIGGGYCTPTTAGSRPGGIVAATWAVMMYRGMEGYYKITKGIHQTIQTIIIGVKSISGIKLAGNPVGMIIAIIADEKTKENLNMFQVMDQMKAHGWSLNSVMKPSGFHFCATEKNIGMGQKFINDLKISVEKVRKNPKVNSGDSAALYGLITVAPKKFVPTLAEVLLSYMLDGKNFG